MSFIGAIRYIVKTLKGGEHMLKPGDPAPEIDTKDHNGKPVKLRDLRGKKVVLWFFPKADTPG
jgi:peroxiredoxin Q/BCP